MAKSSVQIRFDNLVSQKLWPLFKELGYQRQGNNFRQYYPAGWGRILNVQKSAFNDTNCVRFTLNIGLYLLVAEQINNWGRISAERFLEPDCLVRKRIGKLNGTQGDIWYELTPATLPDTIEQQVLADVQQYVLPYLARVHSGHELAAQIVREKDPNSIDGIRAALVSGLEREALQWLEDELAATIYQYKKTTCSN